MSHAPEKKNKLPFVVLGVQGPFSNLHSRFKQLLHTFSVKQILPRFCFHTAERDFVSGFFFASRAEWWSKLAAHWLGWFETHWKRTSENYSYCNILPPNWGREKRQTLETEPPTSSYLCSCFIKSSFFQNKGWLFEFSSYQKKAATIFSTNHPIGSIQPTRRSQAKIPRRPHLPWILVAWNPKWVLYLFSAPQKTSWCRSRVGVWRWWRIWWSY